MRRVLVTGSTGFTARYVVPQLERAGFEVCGVSRRGGPGERELTADITDMRSIGEAVARVRPSHVIHLAGTSNLPDTEAGTLYKVNVEGTRNLLDACARLPSAPERILLASSGYVYGDTGDTPAAEDRAPAPVGEYGRSKLEMERAAATWAAKLPILIVRPFNYTGVGHGERFLVPKLVKVFAERGADVSFVEASVVRDFSDVRWVAGTYVLLLSVHAAFPALNVCSGIPTPLAELVRLLERITGHAPRVAPSQGPRPVRSLVGSTRLLRGAGIGPGPSLEQTLAWMLGAAGERG